MSSIIIVSITKQLICERITQLADFFSWMLPFAVSPGLSTLVHMTNYNPSWMIISILVEKPVQQYKDEILRIYFYVNSVAGPPSNLTLNLAGPKTLTKLMFFHGKLTSVKGDEGYAGMNLRTRATRNVHGRLSKLGDLLQRLSSIDYAWHLSATQEVPSKWL